MNDTPAQGQLLIIWEYWIAHGREKEFAEMYGPNGDWAKLFDEAPGYVRSDLLLDKQDPSRAIVMDWWESRQQYTAFLHEFKAEYEAINARAEMLNSSECCLGWFFHDPAGPGLES